MNDTEILSEQATIRSMVRGASHQPATVNLDHELNDALDAYSQRLKDLSMSRASQQAIRGPSAIRDSRPAVRDTRPAVRPNWDTDNDEQTASDIDLVIESLALQGEREEAERIRKANARHDKAVNIEREAHATSGFGLFPHNELMFQEATSKRFSAFDVSNALLDVIDDGHLVCGLRYGWKFDYPDEDRANAERLDFRDLVLARLKGATK